VGVRRPAPGDLSVHLGSLRVGDLWFVPAAALGLPGLLVLLWVGAQLGGGLIWLPAARRLSRDDAARRRPIRR
jgi:hypothetical protein